MSSRSLSFASVSSLERAESRRESLTTLGSDRRESLLATDDERASLSTPDSNAESLYTDASPVGRRISSISFASVRTSRGRLSDAVAGIAADTEQHLVRADSLMRSHSNQAVETMYALDPQVANNVVPRGPPQSREEQAAVDLQRVARGWFARRDYLNLLFEQYEQQEAARQAQEQRDVEDSLRMLDSLQSAQDLERQHVVRRRKEMQRSRSAVLVQRAWRRSRENLAVAAKEEQSKTDRASAEAAASCQAGPGNEDDPYTFVPRCRSRTGLRTSASRNSIPSPRPS